MNHPGPPIVSGHAATGSRQDFLDHIEARTPPEDPALRRLIGKLWNCTDTLGTPYCQDVGVPPGSTFAQAVRSMRRP